MSPGSNTVQPSTEAGLKRWSAALSVGVVREGAAGDLDQIVEFRNYYRLAT